MKIIIRHIPYSEMDISPTQKDFRLTLTGVPSLGARRHSYSRQEEGYVLTDYMWQNHAIHTQSSTTGRDNDNGEQRPERATELILRR